MADDHGFSLTLDLQDGYRFLVDFDQEGVPPLLIDEPEPLGEGTGPDAARVLAAAGCAWGHRRADRARRRRGPARPDAPVP